MLYLILPYFDFNQSLLPKKNLDLFISNYAQRANLRIVLCEGIYNQELPDYSNKIFKHLKFKLNNVLWVKENLINLAIKNLPDDAKFIAWSDRDIYFLNPSWVEDTIEKLKIYDMVQPWSEIIHLNAYHKLEVMSKREDALSFSNKSILCADINYKNHSNKINTSTGQIWSITKSFYEQIGKINDIEIIGGADSIIANFCVLKRQSYMKNLDRKSTIKTKNNWLEYQSKFNNVRYSYVDGLIIHYWHGALEDRLYSKRFNILKHLNYDPDQDIMYDKYGVLQFTEKGKKLEPLIREYFIHRKRSEDKIYQAENLTPYYNYTTQTYLTAKTSKNYEN